MSYTPIDYTNPATGATLSNYYTYMAWQLITDRTSLQWKLKDEAGQNFDAEGFGIINGRYVIACTSPIYNGGQFGSIGDYIDWELHDGTILHTVVGDEKNHDDPEWIPIGHLNNENHAAATAVSVIEFVVDQNTWYYPPKDNPGTPSNHPEWAGGIRGWSKVGNFWGDVDINSINSGEGNGVSSSSGGNVSHIVQPSNDTLALYFKTNPGPLLFYRQNTIWIPQSGTTAPAQPDPVVPSTSWGRAQEAFEWVRGAMDMWPYNQGFVVNGVDRGFDLSVGTGCDCSGFVWKILYNFAPNTFNAIVNQPEFNEYFRYHCGDTASIFNFIPKVWDSTESSEWIPSDIQPGDILCTSSNWYAGQSFPSTYGGRYIRHVLMYMTDGTWWDVASKYGPSNYSYGHAQDTATLWATGWNVTNSTRAAIVRPNWLD